MLPPKSSLQRSVSPATSSDYAPSPASYRASHSKKKQPDHIPRPPNAFMIFRSQYWQLEKLKSSAERDHREISRMAGIMWKAMSPAERAPFKQKADEVKRRHMLLYPDYKYSPVYSKGKPAKK
ncbi:HMG-box, partial [Panus rudis PR-1116 ss-1]